MFQIYLPETLWSADKQSEVEEYLVNNIPDPSLRKQVLLDWCRFFNIPFAAEKAKRIGAEEIPPP